MSDRLRARRVPALVITIAIAATFAWSHIAAATERPRPQSVPSGFVASGGASSPQGAPVPAGWLQAFNHYRDLAGLPPVTENTTEDYPEGSGLTWSAGGALHSRWMVKNQTIQHGEAPSSNFYTEAGDLAGQRGNIMITSDYGHTPREAIEGWITAPFHAIGMLDPNLAETGYGDYREKRNGYRFGATVDVIRGRGLVPVPGVTFPVMFPGDGTEIYLDRYPGGEQPDPLDAPGCASYIEPTGLPVYLLLDDEEELVDTSFKRGTTELPHCAYDDDGYSGSEPGDLGMGPRNAIFLIPKKPLASEKRFHVSIETNSATYPWSFRTGDTKAPTSKVRKPADGKVYDQDRLSKVNGTASGDTQRVHVSIAGYVGNQRCRFLKGDGSFTGKRDCFDYLWLKANGKSEWARAYGRKLPPSFHPTKGGQIYEIKNYYALSRARDEVGNTEREPTSTVDWTIFHVTP